MAEPLDLSGPIRVAILSNTAIIDLLAIWQGEPAVFTRVPVPIPDDTPYPYPMIVVPADVSLGNQDLLTTFVPTVRRDIIVYGQQPDDYRAVEMIGYLLRKQFHRQKFSISVGPVYRVLDIVAIGPIRAPTDDEKELARALLLAIRLEELVTS